MHTNTVPQTAQSNAARTQPSRKDQLALASRHAQTFCGLQKVAVTHILRHANLTVSAPGLLEILQETRSISARALSRYSKYFGDLSGPYEGAQGDLWSGQALSTELSREVKARDARSRSV